MLPATQHPDDSVDGPPKILEWSDRRSESTPSSVLAAGWLDGGWPRATEGRRIMGLTCLGVRVREIVRGAGWKF